MIPGMEKTPVVAVLDVGKTNKKVALYDRDLRSVDLRRTSLDAQPGSREGEEWEQTDALFEWTCSALRELGAEYEIRAIGITTHGATMAVLDAEGALAHPVLSYLSPAGEEVEEEFNARFGPPERVQAETCTPPFGFANAAKQIFYLRKFHPDAWQRAARLLFFPQYIGFRLTGGEAADPTYLGCHTYLWLPEAGRPSSIAADLGVVDMIPGNVLAPWERLGGLLPGVAEKCGLPAGLPVTVGIHDSNASLLPYLAKDLGNFTLNSTGTWCVAMTPSDSFGFSEEELGTKTFYNLSAFGKPVKTSIFPGGLEYSEFSGLAGEGEADASGAVEAVCAERELFLTGGIVPGAKAFPGSVPAAHDGGRVVPLEQLREKGLSGAGLDRSAFLAALNLSLAIQTVEVLERAGRTDGTDVFIEGGFSRNDDYCRILAALLPRNRVCRTELAEATAFGTALCSWILADGVSLEDLAGRFAIKVEPVEAPDLPGLAEYANEYRRKAGQS